MNALQYHRHGLFELKITFVLFAKRDTAMKTEYNRGPLSMGVPLL